MHLKEWDKIAQWSCNHVVGNSGYAQLGGVQTKQT